MVIIISEFGIKIKNISAGTLYDVNLGTRDYFSYTEAMLNNSLFSAFLIKNGLNVYKGESTRDIICLDFDFGTRSYEDEHKRIEQLYKNSDGELKERLKYTLEKVENNKDLYDEKKREQIRDKFYNEGVDVTYKTKNKDGSIKSEETIHYEMLFRTSAKAKLGQVIFINSELYKVAYEWLTIGLGKLMTDDNAKIVEMSAYAPLTTSTIVGTKYIPVEDILILQDQDSFFKTMANIVRAEDYVDSKGRICKKCVVDKKVTEVKNTLWDGMGLIEADYFKDCRNAYNPDWTVKINGMALMRHHLFKMCGFKSHIQLFFKDWCEKTGNDYETYKIQDMFGHWHYLKDIKIITTDNAIKWKKFKDLMGGSLESAYEYWCKKVNEDGSVFGVVKSDHPSKLGEYQQLSYQMVNTLPCTKDDVKDIASTSIEYVELLKQDNDEFEKFLRKNANEVNHYEMMADLYDHNHEFGNSTFFRHEKSKIISAYVHKLRKGKIVVNGDNLTVSAFIINSALPTSSNDYISNIKYVETQEGLMTEELGLMTMRYFYQYDCDYIAIDANGVGQGVLDYLMQDRYDPIYNMTYGALNCCNNDDLADRCKVRNAPKVIYAIKASAKSNNDMCLALRSGFQNGNINLLNSETEIDEKLQKLIKGFNKLSDTQKIKLRLPYYQTTFLIEELINLDHEVNNGLIKVKEKSGMRKDRYSSLEYNYYVVQELALKLKPKNTNMKNLADILPIRTAKRHSYFD